MLIESNRAVQNPNPIKYYQPTARNTNFMTLKKVSGDLRDGRRSGELLRLIGVGEDALPTIPETPATGDASFAFLLYATTSIAAVAVSNDPEIIPIPLRYFDGRFGDKIRDG